MLNKIILASAAALAAAVAFFPGQSSATYAGSAVRLTEQLDRMDVMLVARRGGHRGMRGHFRARHHGGRHWRGRHWRGARWGYWRRGRHWRGARWGYWRGGYRRVGVYP